MSADDETVLQDLDFTPETQCEFKGCDNTASLSFGCRNCPVVSYICVRCCVRMLFRFSPGFGTTRELAGCRECGHRQAPGQLFTDFIELKDLRRDS